MFSTLYFIASNCFLVGGICTLSVDAGDRNSSQLTTMCKQPLLLWHHLQLRHYSSCRSYHAVLFLSYYQVDMLVT